MNAATILRLVLAIVAWPIASAFAVGLTAFLVIRWALDPSTGKMFDWIFDGKSPFSILD